MDGTHDTVIEREMTARLIHEALGRQLKVTAFLAVVLGAFGFLLGHYVADLQSRETTDLLRDEISDLQLQVSRLADRSARHEDQQARLAMAVTDIEALRREEAERSEAALHTLAAVIENRRRNWLRQLEQYSGGRRYVPPEMVVDAVNRYVDEQMTVVGRVLDVTGETAAPLPPGDPDSVTLDLPPGGRVKPGAGADAERTADETLPPEPRADGFFPARPAVPGPELPAPGDAAQDEAETSKVYFTPPRRKGFRFYSPKQPAKIDTVDASEPAAIPLPPLSR